MSDDVRIPSEANGYWQQSRLPLAALCFVAPLLVLYEGGLLWFGTEAIRNGADAWLRRLLQMAGFGQYFLLPVLTVCLLLGWHFTTRQRWRFSPAVLLGMAAESMLLALALWQLAQWHGMLMGSLAEALQIGGGEGTWPKLLVAYVGAGIYEELLFRLALYPLVLGALIQMGASRRGAIAGAVLLTSLLFALAHHGPGGEPFSGEAFLFRTAAGVFFTLLFVFRGFGIVAGTHAAYDVLVGIVFA